MSRKYLGDTFDIHTGGEDNIFPHHECEIAQSEAFTGKPFVKVWIHARHLLWDEKKMSKSEGTFFTIQNLLDRGYSGEAIRYALVTTHYRQQVNYTMKSFDDAKSAVRRIQEGLLRLLEFEGGGKPGPELVLEVEATKARERFTDAMDNDLNTSLAVGVIHELVRAIHRQLDQSGLGSASARPAIETLLKLMGVFGIGTGNRVAMPVTGELKATLDPVEARFEGVVIHPEIMGLVSAREEARKRRDWKESDRLRDEIQKQGWIVKDTKDGTKLTKS